MMRATATAGTILFLQLILMAPAAPTGDAPAVPELVRRSLANTETNWKAAPEYTFVEQDVVEKDDHVSNRTYKVLMIDGSPYNQQIAENGKPLPPDRAAAETKKLREEITRRRSQSQSDRRDRIDRYRDEREQDQALMREMIKAFNFTLIGKETVNGRECYVLNAAPNPNYNPPTRETRVLTGMRGQMWIDAHDYQWVRVQAKVFRPVAFGLFIAHVQPGTQFILEESPVAQGLWMPSQFTTVVHATAFLLWSKDYTRTEKYWDYALKPSGAN